jgi:hypothetical protein
MRGSYKLGGLLLTESLRVGGLGGLLRGVLGIVAVLDGEQGLLLVKTDGQLAIEAKDGRGYVAASAVRQAEGLREDLVVVVDQVPCQKTGVVVADRGVTSVVEEELGTSVSLLGGTGSVAQALDSGTGVAGRGISWFLAC